MPNFVYEKYRISLFYLIQNIMNYNKTKSIQMNSPES